MWIGQTYYEINGKKRFRIFLIIWRWLLTNLKILIFVAVGWATIVCDLMPRIGICCLACSLIEIFWFGYFLFFVAKISSFILFCILLIKSKLLFDVHVYFNNSNKK
jgi:hypothetical protein